MPNEKMWYIEKENDIPKTIGEILIEAKKQERILQEEVLASNTENENIEEIHHIDFMQLKSELQSWNNIPMQKKFIDIDGKSYIVNFLYDPTEENLWLYSEGQISINIALCEEYYDLQKNNNSLLFKIGWFSRGCFHSKALAHVRKYTQKLAESRLDD